MSLPPLVVPLNEWLIILRWSINSKHFLELKAQYQINMGLHLGRRISQMNAVHSLSSNSFKIHFHINTTGVRGSFQSSFFPFPAKVVYNIWYGETIFFLFVVENNPVQLMIHISADVILSLLPVVHDSLPYHNVELGRTF